MEVLLVAKLSVRNARCHMADGAAWPSCDVFIIALALQSSLFRISRHVQDMLRQHGLQKWACQFPARHFKFIWSLLLISMIRAKKNNYKYIYDENSSQSTQSPASTRQVSGLAELWWQWVLPLAKGPWPQHFGIWQICPNFVSLACQPLASNRTNHTPMIRPK